MTSRRTPSEVERDKLEDDIQLAGLRALKKALTAGDPDSANMKNILQVWNERNAEKLQAALAELETLRAAAADNTVLDAAISAKNVAEAELEKIKANLDAVLAEETKKAQNAVSVERQTLQQREITIKRKEDAMAVSTDAALTIQAFTRFHRMVKHLPMGEFFDHESGAPNSPWYWAAWMPMEQAKAWTTWESVSMKLPYEKQLFEIAKGIHAIACIHHSRERLDTSPERKAFLEARLAFLGAEAQNEVFKMIREFSEQCMRESHPLPSYANIDAGYLANQRNRILLGDLPTGDSLLPDWLV
jgi:hypothetical protein